MIPLPFLCAWTKGVATQGKCSIWIQIELGHNCNCNFNILSNQVRKMKMFARLLLAQMIAYSVFMQSLIFGRQFSRNFHILQFFTLWQFLYSGCYPRIFQVFLFYFYFFDWILIATDFFSQKTFCKIQSVFHLFHFNSSKFRII